MLALLPSREPGPNRERVVTSIGFTGINASASGVPLAQTRGSELERAQHQAQSQQRRAAADAKAEEAAGIGATDGEDTQTHDRDADGRRLWEAPAKPPEGDSGEEAAMPERGVKDPRGEAGNSLDLSV
jgi:hypothetical protein